MNRVEKFKELRMRKRRLFFVLILFISINVSGFAVVDYSLNSIMNNEKAIKIICLKRLNSSNIDIGIMNYNMVFDCSFINRSYNKLKKIFKF